MLVWNAIVKNEAAIIDRCVRSLLPHVDGAIVIDTGSSDDTPERITELFNKAGKSIEIHYAPFFAFDQARNKALEFARGSPLKWDYLLLADADMELKISDPDWTRQLNGGLSYDMYQTAGSVRYVNRRVVSRHATGNYMGVTHEYLAIESAGKLEGAEFNDHADGSNRAAKFQRDIDLLEQALKTETDPGLIQRYHFYLAQSFFDKGDWAKAAEHYKIRTELGGFDEEVWNAQLHYAHCLSNLGFDAQFLWEMFRAYRLRPSRVESLYDLAKYFRERGDNHISLLFSEPGMSVPFPRDDLLFVNEYVYRVGLKEEFAVCAYYDPRKRTEGAKVCNQVALSKPASWQAREQARINQYWYLRPLAQHVPSFKPSQIVLQPQPGYVATNPSVINHNGKPMALVRSVNYTITPEGVYAIRGSDGSCNRNNPISTRNYLVGLDHELAIESSHELALPPNWPEPKFDLVRGFEDSRLFEWGASGALGTLYTLSTVRELTPEGWCDQVLASVLDTANGGVAYCGAGTVHVAERRHEKNWMPWVQKDGALQFVYRLGTLIDTNGQIISQHDCDVDVGHISGGSQVINVDGIWLALVHEARSIPGRSVRYYQHRFVVFDDDGRCLRISLPFCFHDRQIEFAAGLSYFPDKRQLLASYGVRDCEAWLATMNLDEVIAFIAEGA
jgi:glycosyltransferase involved in cell wall biosynthesis